MDRRLGREGQDPDAVVAEVALVVGDPLGVGGPHVVEEARGVEEVVVVDGVLLVPEDRRDPCGPAPLDAARRAPAAAPTCRSGAYCHASPLPCHADSTKSRSIRRGESTSERHDPGRELDLVPLVAERQAGEVVENHADPQGRAAWRTVRQRPWREVRGTQGLAVEPQRTAEDRASTRPRAHLGDAALAQVPDRGAGVRENLSDGRHEHLVSRNDNGRRARNGAPNVVQPSGRCVHRPSGGPLPLGQNVAMRRSRATDVSLGLVILLVNVAIVVAVVFLVGGRSESPDPGAQNPTGTPTPSASAQTDAQGVPTTDISGLVGRDADITLAVLGDGTGDEEGEWVTVLGELLGGDRKVKVNNLDPSDPTHYARALSYGSGEHAATIWNGSRARGVGRLCGGAPGVPRARQAGRDPAQLRPR